MHTFVAPSHEPSRLNWVYDVLPYMGAIPSCRTTRFLQAFSRFIWFCEIFEMTEVWFFASECSFMSNKTLSRFSYFHLLLWYCLYSGRLVPPLHIAVSLRKAFRGGPSYFEVFHSFEHFLLFLTFEPFYTQSSTKKLYYRWNLKLWRKHFSAIPT